MASRTVAQSEKTNRISAEQANAWVAKWQASAPTCVYAVLSGKLLAVHAVPPGACMFVLDWSGDDVLLAETQGRQPPYEFTDVNSALACLDGLLMHNLAVREEVAQSAGDPAAGVVRPTHPGR